MRLLASGKFNYRIKDHIFQHFVKCNVIFEDLHIVEIVVLCRVTEVTHWLTKLPVPVDKTVH